MSTAELTLQVIIVLNVVTRASCNLPVHDHELTVECPKGRLVKIDNSQIDVRYIFRRR